MDQKCFFHKGQNYVLIKKNKRTSLIKSVPIGKNIQKLINALACLFETLEYMEITTR